MTPSAKHPLIEAAARRPLTLAEQEELARHFGKSIQDLPLAWRGGLVGVWAQTKPGEPER